MTRLESRLFAQSFATGIICTLIVVTAQAIGLLSPLDDWLYDERAAHAQFATPAPSKQIVHLDIDDASLEAVGRWPWPRATLARILNEVHLARPSAVGLDIFFPEPQRVRYEPKGDGTFDTIDDDAALANALRASGVSVLAASFNLEPEERTWPMLDRVSGWLKEDLELTSAKVAEKLGPAAGMERGALDDLFVHARRLAMRERIDQELAHGDIEYSQLTTKLLPHSDPTIESPLTKLLNEQFVLASADRAILRLGGPAVRMDPPALGGTLDAVPLARFTQAVASCGFVNFDIFGNATVRSIPLIVQYKDKLYPQFGLSVACVALGADPKSVRFSRGTVLIPTRNGLIEIPTYTYHSTSVDKDVPLIAAIPWFGSHDWETMYDWPAHRESSAHISMSRLWDLCLIHDVIAKNSAELDNALVALLAAVSPTFGEHYAASLPDPMDITAREAAAKRAMQELKDSQLLETYDAMPEKEMTPEDRATRDALHKAVHDITEGLKRNQDARQLLTAQREWLASAVRGKAAFVGFTAIGLVDQVNTSLVSRCPGVVVHGVIANAVLTGRWWTMAPSWVALVLTLLFGMTTGFVEGRFPPMRAGLFTLGLGVCYGLVNWCVLFARERVLIDMAGPMTVIGVVWAVCTLQRVIFEGVERIRIGTENEIFQREMALARKVQFALVPDKAPEMPGINAHGWTLPADMTGGDLFDLWKLPDGRLGILVADASGHGLAPAMIVSQVRTLVHMLSEYEASPHDLLRRVNTRLARDLELGRFVTAFLAFLRSDGEFEWASAGHGPMYWCPTGEGELLELDSSGLPLGVQEDWLADDPSPPLKMELTGRLIVFSDGIFEAHAPNPKDGLFGTDPIKEILQNACHASSSEIIHAIREAVQKFQGKKEPVDDQTIVVVRRVPPEEASIDGEAVYNVSAESQGTVALPVSTDFEIAVNADAADATAKTDQ
jgi:CHASE2 domain-containing sensor protein